ncbi:MAG: hypothetical protein AAFO89_05780 [Planctomycetota bacterium]
MHDAKTIGSWLDALRRAAPILDQYSATEPDAEYFVELLSGGIAWKDEYPPPCTKGTGAVSHAIKALWGYRSAIIRGDHELVKSLQPVWDEAKRLMPRWIGFSPERCAQKPEYIRALQESDREVDELFDSC